MATRAAVVAQGSALCAVTRPNGATDLPERTGGSHGNDAPSRSSLLLRSIDLQGSGSMGTLCPEASSQRRNYERRALMVRAVAAALITRAFGDAAPLLDDVPPDAAARIVKRLAVRGLARRSAAGWEATAALMNPASLVAFAAPA